MEKTKAAFYQNEAFLALKSNYDTLNESTHLRELLKDETRNESLLASVGDITLDYTHTKLDAGTYKQLLALSSELGVPEKIRAMFTGAKINQTEGRSVLHVALRCGEGKKIEVDGKNVVADVHEVLGKIKTFSEGVRTGTIKGFSGKRLVNTVVIGIGGSYLGPEFVHEALRFESGCNAAAQGRSLRFLANVDPVDVARATEGLDLEETLFVVNSKTFTTAETMLNARTVRDLIVNHYRSTGVADAKDEEFVAKHICAASTALEKTSEFGIAADNVFAFWDWVGGRYSVCSVIGVLPLALQYGFANAEQFLRGAEDIDNHFLENADEPAKNVPLLLGLLGFFSTQIAGNSTRAILPYSQALIRFAAHIQQLDMESNGKSVTLGGERLGKTVAAGPVVFGEPGTNGQHSFYQLMHQGRTLMSEFIGFATAQRPIDAPAEPVSNHEELMSNFFAQPDALAVGKDRAKLEEEKTKPELVEHKLFEGDRPSLSILMRELTPRSCGSLLAIYEHRVVVEGFLYGVNSFDQWGVELGKVLAKDVRDVFQQAKKGQAPNLEGFNSATRSLLTKYLALKNH